MNKDSTTQHVPTYDDLTQLRQEAFSGQVIGNPLEHSKSLRIKHSEFRLEPDQHPENHGVTSLASFLGVLLSVSLRSEDSQRTHGSAVMVAPGVAITAKHVVEDWMASVSVGTATAVCQAPTPKGVVIWEVSKIVCLANADIAFLCINLRSALPMDNELYVARLTTRSPALGDEIMLCGFVPDVEAVPISSNMTLATLSRLTYGRVTDVWPSGRDSVMIPSMSFAVNCPAFSAMSGGAAFNDDGHLMGIISSSYKDDDIACVSHVVPALTIPLAPTWPRTYAETSLLHLGHKNGVEIHRPDAFQIDVVDGKWGFRYQPWTG